EESLSDVTELIPAHWPDVICVFADELEAEKQDVLAFCQQLREQPIKYRPVFILQSSGPEARRIQYLVQGADDVFGLDLSAEEFKIRLLIHLRRNLDIAANEITQLPGLHFTGKVVERRLNRKQSLSILSVEIDHFDVYSEVYGELPARQVMKTFAAL